MNNLENCICGCVTLEKPYTYEEVINSSIVIKYKDKIVGSIQGELLTDGGKFIKFIIDLLNEAYQNGFSICGTELMTKATNQNNMLEQSNIHQELICSNNDFMPL